MHFKRRCPDRIINNTIHGLVFGLIGGAVYVAVTDTLAKNDLNKTLQSVGRRAPAIAVGTGVVMLVYSALECTLESARNRRDATNCFVAGGVTGALLGARAGPQGVVVNAIIGAVAFGFLDGVL